MCWIYAGAAFVALARDAYRQPEEELWLNTTKAETDWMERCVYDFQSPTSQWTGLLLAFRGKLRQSSVGYRLFLALAMGGSFSFCLAMAVFWHTFHRMSNWSPLILAQCALDTAFALLGSIAAAMKLLGYYYFCSFRSMLGRVLASLFTMAGVYIVSLSITTNFLIIFTTQDRLQGLLNPNRYRFFNHRRRCCIMCTSALVLGLAFTLTALYLLRVQDSNAKCDHASDSVAALVCSRRRQIAALCRPPEWRDRETPLVSSLGARSTWGLAPHIFDDFDYVAIWRLVTIVNTVLGVAIAYNAARLVRAFRSWQRLQPSMAQNMDTLPSLAERYTQAQSHERSVTRAILLEGLVAVVSAFLSTLYTFTMGHNGPIFWLIISLPPLAANSFLLVTLTSPKFCKELFKNPALVLVLPHFRIVKQNRRNLVLSYYLYFGFYSALAALLLFSA